MKRLLLTAALSLFFFVPQFAFAAIALDNTGQTASANASTVTIASFVVSATNPMIFVVVRDLDNTLTGITYNSVAMTQIGSTQSAGGNNTSFWYLYGQSGTHDIVATKGSGSSNIRIAADSYTGVNQATPEANTTGTGPGGTSFSQSVTTIADNAWVVWGVGQNTGSPPTAGSGTTLRIDDAKAVAIMDFGSAKTPAGSVTLNASTAGSADAWGGTIVSIAPAAAAAAAAAPNAYAQAYWW